MFNGLKKWAEERIADINPFDGGKTAQTVRQARQAQPAVTQRAPQPQVQQRPSYGSGITGVVNRARDIVDANTPQDRFKRQIQNRPIIDTTFQDDIRNKLGQVKNTALGVGKTIDNNATNVVNVARDQLDANTQADRTRRLNAGQAELYTDQQRAKGISERSINNNIAQRAVNTTRAFAEGMASGPLALGRAVGNAAAMNSGDYKRAEQSERQNREVTDQVNATMWKVLRDPNASQIQKDHAVKVLNIQQPTGMQDVRTKIASENNPARLVAAAADTGLTIATAGMAGVSKQGVKAAYNTAKTAQLANGATVKQAANAGVKAGIKNLASTTAKSTATGAGAGFAGVYTADPNATLKQGLTGAVQGGVMGGALPLGIVGASYAPRIVKSGIQKTPAIVRSARSYSTANQNGFVANPFYKDGDPLEALKAEAKKYKSAEEFVKDNAIRAKLQADGIPVNPDGTVTLYHATGAKDAIMKDGFIKGGTSGTGGMTGLQLEPSAFLGTNKAETSKIWGGGGKDVVEVRVPAKYIRQPAKNLNEVYFEGGLKRQADGTWKPVKEPRSTFYDQIAVRDYGKQLSDVYDSAINAKTAAKDSPSTTAFYDNSVSQDSIKSKSAGGSLNTESTHLTQSGAKTTSKKFQKDAPTDVESIVSPTQPPAPVQKPKTAGASKRVVSNNSKQPLNDTIAAVEEAGAKLRPTQATQPPAPVQKPVAVQKPKTATATSEATPTQSKVPTQEQTLPQNQLETTPTAPVATGKKPQVGEKQQLSQNAQSSSTPIIQPNASKRTTQQITKDISKKDSELYIKNNTKIKVDQRGGKKVVDINNVDKTKTGIDKTNLRTGKTTSYMVDDKGELVPDSNGAYKIVTDNDGKITQIRIGDEVFSGEVLDGLTNIKNYGSSVATMRRNLERAIPDQKTRDTVISMVVDHQQHQATKMVARHSELKNGLEALTKDLGISFGVGRHRAKKVSAAIQDFGEGKRDYNSLVDEFGKDYADKIVNADKWFREQYDTLLDEMNATLTRYGYDPIPKRANYYTHFQDDSLFRKYGLKMQEVNEAFGGPMQEANPTGTRGAISNLMAGLSQYMTPNRRFNPFGLQRKGEQHTSDAFGAFERYLSPTLNNIYMTPSITRARVIAKAIAMENDRVGNNVNNIVTQVREWANHLAGKSQQLDRFMIDRKGLNQALRMSNWIQKKVGGNSIVGNFATAVMQPIVLAQTSGKAGYKNTLLAMMQEMGTSHGKNAPIRQSEFMKRRYTNVENVTRGKVQRGADVAGVPLKVIEETSARITWNAHYNRALEKGLKGKQAIRYADIEAEKTMAGRAIGEKPELYRSKAAGPVTQFMLEVNNYIQQVGKEMTPAQVAKTFVAAYGINLVMQEVTGRQVGFNPIDAAIDNIQTLTDDDKNGGEKAKEIAQRWAGEVVMNTPGASNVLDVFMDDQDAKKFFGTQTPVGRYGVGSTYGSIYDNTVGKVLDGKYGEAAAYAAMPWGYNQAQKTVKGVSAWKNGEMTDKDGKTTVEIPQTPGNLVRGALFGPSAIKEVNQYYNNLGKKKEDQTPVQNQTNSIAAKQGNVQKPTSTKLTLEQAQAIQKKEYGGKYANMNQDEIKELAKTDSEAKSYLKSWEATTAAYGKTPDLPDGLSDSAKKIFEVESRLTQEGKDKWNKRKNTDQSIKDTLKNWNNGEEVPVTNAVAKAWAEYEKKRLEGSISDLEMNKEKKSVLRKAYSSVLNKDEKDYWDVPDNDILAGLEQGLVTEESLRKAMDVDALLVSKGLISSSGFGKKVWNALGMNAPKGSTTSSSRTSSRSTGRKSTAKKSGGRKSTGTAKKAAKYDYNIFGMGYDPTSKSKSLRELVKKATAKA